MMHQCLACVELLPYSNHCAVDNYGKFIIIAHRGVLCSEQLLTPHELRTKRTYLETRIGDYLSPLSLAELSVDVFRLTHKAEMTSGPAGLGLQDKTVGVLSDWLLST
jgi:hypothetical protein